MIPLQNFVLPKVSHILLQTNLEKLVSNVTITYYTQYIHGQYPSAPIRDLTLHYGLLPNI